MGKAKKIKASQTPQNLPLAHQIERAGTVVERDVSRAKAHRGSKYPENAEGDQVVGGKLSQQILSQARQQLEELAQESPPTTGTPQRPPLSRLGPPLDADDDDDADDLGLGSDHPDPEMDGADFATDLHINEKDNQAFAAFMTHSNEPKRTLAQIIQAKIDEKRTEIETEFSDAGSLQKQAFDPATVAMFEGVGRVLARYRSGKVPKAFKVVPQFRHWEDLILLTQPDNWSAAAMYQATKIFASNLRETMAQRFYNYILLPRVRDDIDTYQRLNFHLYQALRKALFKPGAFFKGFLIPLCEAGDCTLREAIIIGSVLAKNSIPIMHSCATMLKIAEMEYSGANSIFLRIFLDKKYALPFRVVDAVVFHFLRFRSERRELPVLWHQSFLTFVQRYKGHVSSEQRDGLLELLRFQQHHGITPEIRRELANAKCRDMEVAEPMESL
ncbi:hypothetical protein TCAL_02448 [Tigriopus californicus]|uniref:Bystin n=1 Tax=Tigriopus californicus TaxID=6832 RepID=A0A553NZV3_TIGCA|nr:bystin-like [Tigriopus californicus]TRY70969.1 hypothetical protein TCAL_02448 [Tigriopus californicus]|eukprot:TCALIF_02448-PA protein Name:"Similar to BYSL Bystin (Homo sapiens)" AED:0.00 eAED:0.00 QI:124/1/1/1/1/1/2/55/442